MHWQKPRRIFVDSMSDLFHESLTFGQIMRVWMAISRAPQHTYLILTKRAQRQAEFMRQWADVAREDVILARGPEAVRQAHTCGRARLFADYLETFGPKPDGAAFPTYDWAGGPRWWPSEPSNVWFGVSVEDRGCKNRADLLRSTPAAVRFLSMEPLLEDLGKLDLTGIGWCIVGGESGPGARPMHPDWAQSIRDQCIAAGTAFFFKQWGEWKPCFDPLCDGSRCRRMSTAGRDVTPNMGWWKDGDQAMARVGKRAAGRLLDGREWNEMPRERGSHGPL
jgi:protein gp37